MHGEPEIPGMIGTHEEPETPGMIGTHEEPEMPGMTGTYKEPVDLLVKMQVDLLVVSAESVGWIQ